MERIRRAMIAAAIILTSCAAPGPRGSPSVEFTNLPPFEEGSSEKLYPIEGRARGAQPGERIVLYARSGVWWVQPTVVDSLTPIVASTWKNQTHPGSAYAALLVTPGYHPLSTTEALPEKSASVLAVAVKEGPRLPIGAKTVMFAGYDWQVRSTPSNPGGARNDYASDNVWTDNDGYLHMRIAGAPGRWTSAEVSLGRSLGYGSYRFVIRNLSHLEPAAVFAMFALDDTGADCEMDIEISRWGEPTSWNGQFVVQPYHVPANTYRFPAPSGRSTYLLQWEIEKASFAAYGGVDTHPKGERAASHVFTSGVPSPGKDTIHMNLYVFDNQNQPLRRGTEVVVEKFEYLP